MGINITVIRQIADKRGEQPRAGGVSLAGEHRDEGGVNPVFTLRSRQGGNSAATEDDFHHLDSEGDDPGTSTSAAGEFSTGFKLFQRDFELKQSLEAGVRARAEAQAG